MYISSVTAHESQNLNDPRCFILRDCLNAGVELTNDPALNFDSYQILMDSLREFAKEASEIFCSMPEEPPGYLFAAASAARTAYEVEPIVEFARLLNDYLNRGVIVTHG